MNDQCPDCGALVEGETQDALIDAVLEHFTTTHPEFGLNRTSVENFYSAKERLSTDLDRVDEIGEIVVKKITDDVVEDAMTFLDRDAFAATPGWASCYCMFFHRDDPQSNGANSWATNREDMKKRLMSGLTTAYLAYVDGVPGGWCNASVRSAYPTRKTGDNDEKVGVIACFIIAPKFRRHGLSRELLKAAVVGFEAMGMTQIEAHPGIGSEDQAGNFRGPLDLYLKAGFEVVKQSERDALVRLSL